MHSIRRFAAALLAFAVSGPIVAQERTTEGNSPDASRSNLPATDSYEPFRAYERVEEKTIQDAQRREFRPDLSTPSALFSEYGQFDVYATQQDKQAKEESIKGQNNHSRPPVPEYIERRRDEPDIANPGPDLPNFPNSPFTLPRGRVYVEVSPFTYSGAARATPEQYNTEFLLRYGLTGDIELRLFGNGASWIGGSNSTWGFSPIAFDTKILMWTENQDYFLPAAGFEAYIQTQWLGSSTFNAGTQPSFTFNFDQSLPCDVDLGYSFSATRSQDFTGKNVWAFDFQWALQRDLFNKDFAVFVHGFYYRSNFTQNAVGAGFVWTVNQRFAVYGEASGGTTQFTPSLISNVGFAIAF